VVGEGVVVAARGRCRDRVVVVVVVDAGGSRASLSAADLGSAMPGLRHQEGSCLEIIVSGCGVSYRRCSCYGIAVLYVVCWAAGVCDG
jgi:hypothetical protein